EPLKVNAEVRGALDADRGRKVIAARQVDQALLSKRRGIPLQRGGLNLCRFLRVTRAELLAKCFKVIAKPFRHDGEFLSHPSLVLRLGALLRATVGRSFL